MKYFFDTEFIESGAHMPIDLISIGIVAKDGREYYAISKEFDPSDASDWVAMNVLTQLEPVSKKRRQSLNAIGRDIKKFCDVQKYGKPEFWAYCADYDWVVFCQIFGCMVDLPQGWPQYCHDLKQWCDELGNPPLHKQGEGEHNSLSDARWNRDVYQFLWVYQRDNLGIA